jgi:hypothetical protein
VENAAPAANAAPPFNTSRREIEKRFIPCSPLVKGEVAYPGMYPLFRGGAFSLSSTARSQCS